MIHEKELRRRENNRLQHGVRELNDRETQSVEDFMLQGGTIKFYKSGVKGTHKRKPFITYNKKGFI